MSLKVCFITTGSRAVNWCYLKADFMVKQDWRRWDQTNYCSAWIYRTFTVSRWYDVSAVVRNDFRVFQMHLAMKSIFPPTAGAINKKQMILVFVPLKLWQYRLSSLLIRPLGSVLQDISGCCHLHGAISTVHFISQSSIREAEPLGSLYSKGSVTGIWPHTI